MKVSTSQFFKQAVEIISKQHSDVAEQQARLGTGKQLVRPSDDAQKTALIQRLKSGLTVQQNYQSGLEELRTRLISEESVLSSAENLLLRIKELAVRGASESMSVGDQLLFFCRLRGMSRVDSNKQINYWLDKFEVINWKDQKIHSLSKGMAQKVQFIVTVLHKPKLLIFDEPFSGFDPINANLIKDEILKLNKEGATVIFSTHRMESVEELCEYITLINKSNKILDGNLDEIKKEFKTNTFEVAVSAPNPKSLENKLKLEYEIFAPTFRTIGENLRMNIKLKSEQNSSKLINLLNKNSRLIHFKEVIPNVNEIFINSVQND